jgi:hypothetical protein
VRQPIEGKIEKLGRVVMMIALALATGMLVLAVAALISGIVQRQFQGPPTQDREAFETPQPRAQP